MENKTPISFDHTHDLLNLQANPLSTFFSPQSIALIGASEKEQSVGRTTFENLLRGKFKGPIYPVNPSHNTILAHEAFKSVLDLPGKADLAVIVTPAQAVPDILRQCIQVGIPSAIIISAGFKEAGADGKQLEDSIISLARHKIRLIGPNCLGLMNPSIGLNATFAQSIANSGNVAFISQSGALCTAILDWSLKESFGFSGFVSTGSMADVGWGDLIDYFGADEKTKSIVIYMESVGNARSFLSAAREVALSKPIIVIKAGRTPAAAKAAVSHTGSLTGSDEVLNAAFRRCGVLRVNDISEVFYMADILGKQPLPKGRRLAIVSNAGGPGVLATDALIAGGGTLADLSETTLAWLNQVLPPAWSHANPIDVLGDATAARYAQTLKCVVDEKESDGILVITTPQGMTHPSEIADSLIPYAKESKKPILASWMGGDQVKTGIQTLQKSGIPTFPFPDAAVQAFNYMWQSREALALLYETPAVSEQTTPNARLTVAALLSKIRALNRTVLTEFESKQILSLYGIPTVPTEIARSADEAVTLAIKFGFPVVLKVHSETITHKTDVGGVQLNLRSESEVQKGFATIQANLVEKASAKDFLGVTVQPMVPLEGYELIVGSSIDPQFGPVLLFGMGGSLVEVFKDRSLALPPLNTTLARRMMERTLIYSALKGVRGHKPVDLTALEKLLVRFSDLVIEHPEISEIDINPVLASESRLVALDARIVLQQSDLKHLPIPAIRPYPLQYAIPFLMKNNESVIIRPIRPDDEGKIHEFHAGLSEQSVYSRYLKPFHLNDRTTHERLTRICFIDYDREMALVAEKNQSDARTIVAVGRLKKNVQKTQGELSVIVADSLQRQGLGLEIIKRLIQIAKNESLDSVSGSLHPGNKAMRSIFDKLGFSTSPRGEGLIMTLNKLRG